MCPALAADRRFLDETVALVREAGDLTLRWFERADLTVDRKGDGTPVTDADRAAERFLRQQIWQRYPDDSIIGEEEESHEGSSGRTWIIDPIDGTKAFTRGVPLYSNLLAVNDTAGPLIGLINLPALGNTVYAGRGLGCFRDGRPVHVADPVALADACVSSSGYTHWDDDVLLRLKHAGPALRTWGDGYGFALVACGQIEAMIDPEAALWDLAPMPVIMAEAGGRFSSWDGAEDPGGGSAVASGGIDHDALLDLLNGTTAPDPA